MGHPRQAPPRSHEQQEEVRIAVPVQEERPSTCQHVRQRLSHCSRPQKLQRCSGLTRRQLPDGRRQASSRLSGRSADIAGTGRLRFALFWRGYRSSARNDARPQSGVTAPGTAGTRSCAISQRPFAKQFGGSTPAASTPHRGARFAFDAMMSIGQWSCRGRSGLLDVTSPGEPSKR
jgi:hypothetical protein